MYGSHYSTAVGSVLFFLLRMQPFSQLHCQYQSGHFDVPDRLFQSIPATWATNLRSASEVSTNSTLPGHRRRRRRHSLCHRHRCDTATVPQVKELLPEFFYLPHFLQNHNGYDFGLRRARPLRNS